ncbi:hypothetical protein B0H10DRAFT_2248061 [Mycena sp. CBHHK59/15]|nr:hypothetical protein B0H10DRAFT_2248061 [Mycena sp. CBHHK59/15]
MPQYMTLDNIIDLLDGLDLDIRGFEDSQSESSLLFPLAFSDAASTSTLPVDVAFDEDELEYHSFELLEEIPLGPRKWVAAGPPAWDTLPALSSIATHSNKGVSLCGGFQGLMIDVAPCSPSRSASRPLPKENLPSPSPTERSFARLRDRSSNRTSFSFFPFHCRTNVAWPQ